MFKNLIRYFFGSLFILISSQLLGQSIDRDFTPQIYGFPTVNRIAVQNDGKVIIHGTKLKTIGNKRIDGITRINIDGTVDESFNPSVSADFYRSIRFTDDGKIILVTLDQGPAIVLLNENGSLSDDFNFVANINSVYDVVPFENFFIAAAFVEGAASIIKLNSDGSVDETFNKITTNGNISYLELMPDGSILGYGQFTEVNNSPKQDMFLFNTEGVVDSGFDIGTGFDSDIRDVRTQADGKLLVATGSSSFNGTPLPSGLLRLNTDGSIDSNFIMGPLSNIITRGIYAVDILTDGGIAVGGFSFNNSSFTQEVALLNSDGSIDNNFSPKSLIPRDINLMELTVGKDDQIFVGSQFIGTQETLSPGFIAFDKTGKVLDIKPNLSTTALINDITEQQDGKIVIAGNFFRVNETIITDIARLNVDGSIDDTFSPVMTPQQSVDAFTSSVALQSDGKILVGGYFRSIIGNERGNLFRLNTDGSIDNTFTRDVTTLTVSQGVTDIFVDDEDNLLISGFFNFVGQERRNSVAKLNKDGTVIASYNSQNTLSESQWIYGSALDSDGKLYLHGIDISDNSKGFVLRLDDKGDIDPTFEFTEIGNLIPDAGVLLDDQIIISGYLNGGSGNDVLPLYQIDLTGKLISTANLGVSRTLGSQILSLHALDNETLLIGGVFDKVNGLDRKGMAKVKLTGQVDERVNFAVTNHVNGFFQDANGQVIITGDIEDIDGDRSFLSIAKLTVENSVPEITGVTDALSTNEDTPITLSTSDLQITDLDDPIENISISNISAGDNYTVTANTITPSLDYSGNLSVMVTVTDGIDISTPFDLVIEVIPVNDAPVITGTANALNTDEDISLRVTLADLTVTDVDNVFPDDFSLTLQSGDNYTLDDNSISPSADFNGDLIVGAIVNDGNLDSEVFNITVSVTAVNDAPVITGTANELSTDEDTNLEVTLTDLMVTDVDNPFPDDFSLTLQSGDNYTLDDNSISPSADFNGELIVRAIVNDGNLDSEVFNITVSITAVNDAPVITGTANELNTDEDTNLEVMLTDLMVTDVDNVFPDDFSLTLQSGNNYTLDGNSISPSADFNGELTIGAVVNDGDLDSEIFNITVSVTAVNDAPVITGTVNELIISKNDELTLTLTDLTVTDVDNNYPDGFSLTLGSGNNYTLEGNTITPTEDFLGSLSVPVTVSDGSDDSEIFNLTITVSPVLNTEEEDFSKKITIGPNPAGDRLKIRLQNNLLTEVQVVIVDGKGETIYRGSFQKLLPLFEKTLDVSSYPKGIYIIEISQGAKHRSTKRMIKN